MEWSESKIKEYIADICHTQNVYLIDVDVSGGGKSRQVKITVDTEKGITLDECQQISREIGDIFFRKDIYPDGYNLEVTSPGIDKPLQHDFEYTRNIGRDLTVNYMEEDKEKQITGELKQFSGGELHLMVGKESFKIPLSQVRHAKIKLKW